MIVIHDVDLLQVLLLLRPWLAEIFDAVLAYLADTPVPFRLATWRAA
jgi:hypothetical protein